MARQRAHIHIGRHEDGKPFIKVDGHDITHGVSAEPPLDIEFDGGPYGRHMNDRVTLTLIGSVDVDLPAAVLALVEDDETKDAD